MEAKYAVQGAVALAVLGVKGFGLLLFASFFVGMMAGI